MNPDARARVRSQLRTQARYDHIAIGPGPRVWNAQPACENGQITRTLSPDTQPPRIDLLDDDGTVFSLTPPARDVFKPRDPDPRTSGASGVEHRGDAHRAQADPLWMDPQGEQFAVRVTETQHRQPLGGDLIRCQLEAVDDRFVVGEAVGDPDDPVFQPWE